MEFIEILHSKEVITVALGVGLFELLRLLAGYALRLITKLLK